MHRNIVLVSHGDLAYGMMSAVKMVFGESAELSCACLAPDGSCVEIIGKIADRAAAHPETQFVVIADILGGSVCNQCVQQLLDMPNTKVISGMSLGLVLGVLCSSGQLSDKQLQVIIEESKERTNLLSPKLISDGTTSGEEDFF
ncbi:PTS system fructose subfamily IIA component [Coriobacterium glomerans PW2]|uniref:PTS system fructose subfamily IIA component n=1 Tax=Coriobacterium glomerans (strain ATCC 49209 / DSM 20642 / JCM 10262 / PW2) TaxID=700015 RepID=F2NB28_CORGP|nr:PTS fructose subfamily transporter subunit IIA [Coriobacterium glomerans]AEB07779.1 PTS system fructose subfamily IIA component [Coriobacterium glomerans PW2]